MNILITGGASGLGAAIVKELAGNASNKIYFTYYKSEENALEITNEFHNTISIQCDFNNEESISYLLNSIKDMDLDVLVNNALATISKEHFQKIEPSTFSNSFNVNVVPTLRITQEAIRVFRKKKYGKIITIISSYVINKPPIGMSEYAANKAYLLSMSKSWATENIRFNITSNAISPSIMLTNLTNDTDERVLEQLISGHPLKKLLTVEEVATTTSYLIHASSHINGINIIMNAGSDIV